MCVCPSNFISFFRDKTLPSLFKKSEHADDGAVHSDVSDSSADDAAGPQLDVPDAHLGAQSTMNIHAVSTGFGF